MIARKLFSIVASLLVFVHLSALAGFNFGDLTQDGSGSFNQPISKGAFIDVGTVPVGVNNLTVSLKSTNDVDIQLWDIDSNKPIVGWNIGAMIGSFGIYEKTTYSGITVEYSGYNGDGTGLGNEYIKINGITKNRFLIKAYGYAAGNALVNYSWKGVSAISGYGSGNFNQYINKNSKAQLDGVIPSGITNLTISLSASDDIDIELYDANTGQFVVGWNGGIISSSSTINGIYKSDNITWSGWNGRAYDYGKNISPTNGHIPPSEYGKEWIKIKGELKNSYIMKVFGYQSGNASVNYSWGSNFVYVGILGTAALYNNSGDKNMWSFQNGFYSKLTSAASKDTISVNIPGTTLDWAATHTIVPIAHDGKIDSSYKFVGNNNNYGQLATALRLSALSNGGGSIMIFSDGNSFFTYQKIIAASTGAATDDLIKNKVYMSGYSGGGGDLVDVARLLDENQRNVRILFAIDIIDTLFDATIKTAGLIPKNVRAAISYYQNDFSELANIKLTNRIKAQDPISTMIDNRLISNPIGGTPGGSAHSRIDNDPRVYETIISEVINDYKNYQNSFGTIF